MKIEFGAQIKKMLSCCVGRGNPRPVNLDIQEEYINAFRTESYNEFWARVHALNKMDLPTQTSLGATTSARLPSYRLLVENLLDPDQPTVMRIMSLTRTRTDILLVLYDYFSTTSDASQLCGQLLKDISLARKKYEFLNDLDPSQSGSGRIHVGLTQMARFGRSNPFSMSGQSIRRLQAMRASCSNLLGRLESICHVIYSKISRLNRLKFGSIILVMAVAASLLLIVAAHGLALLVAAPGVMAAYCGPCELERMAKWSAQLNSATKGTYILIRDWDTISRLVDQLSQELEYIGALMHLRLELGNDRLQAGEEVACQLKKNSQIFLEKLDELEEHLYLCMMTINRARNLVIKEIMSPDSPVMNSSNS